MVRTLLTVFLMLFFVGIQAQEAYQKIQPYSLNNFIQSYECQDISGAEEVSAAMDKPITDRPPLKSVGTTIGTTTYDLQTNVGVCRRVMVKGDNVYAMWTMSHTFDLAAPDRGSGFNESNDGGATWRMAPTERLEEDRIGWPNVGMTESGRLFSLSHFASSTNDVNGLSFAYRDPESSNWISTVIPSDPDATWARSAADGEYIHVVTSRFEGDIDGIVSGVSYIRSTDGGDTWEDRILLPRMEEVVPANGWSADTYFIDAKDGVVAAVMGKYGSDLLFWKSMDNGETWNDPVIITNSPAPNVDTANATDGDDPVFEATPLAGGQISVIIDNNGETHIWYDRIFNTLCGNGQAGVCYLPNSTCLMYWNESMGMNDPQVVGATVRQDYDGDGESAIDFNEIESQSYSTSLVGHTSAGVDAAGNLYVAFSSMRDGALEPDRPDRQYRDIYLIKSMDNGATWEGPYNVTDDPTTEDVYPSIARTVDGFVHLVYQSDEFTGVAVNNANGGTTGQDVFVDNNIQYVKIPVEDIVTPDNSNNTNPIAFTYVEGFLPNPLEQCPATIDRFDTHVLDYPDGDLTDQVVIDHTFDINIANDEGYWILTVEDSDGNMIEDIPLDVNGDPILQTVLEDLDPPVLFIEPLIEIGGGLWSIGAFDTIDVVLGSEYVDAGAQAQDEGDVFGCPPSVTVDNPVTTAEATPAGEPFEVVYVATDHTGKTSTGSRYVNVIGADLEKPIIQLLLSGDPNDVVESGSELEVDVQVGAVWEERGFYAYDNVDLDLTDQVIIGGDAVDLEVVGEYIITYNVADAAENIATATRQVNVVDRTGPTIGIIGPVPSVVACGGSYFEFGANAFDEVDGTVEVAICGDVVCPTQAGSYIVVYTAMDNSCNVTTEERLVIVQGECDTPCDGPSTIACPEPDPENCAVNIEDSYLYQAVTLRPNPTRGILNIDVEGLNLENATVEVYSLVGELIHSTPMIPSIDISTQPAGIYVVKVNTAEGSIAKKIILDK